MTEIKNRDQLKKRVEEKLMDILSQGYKAHYILKKVLKDDTLFVDNRDILDVIFIKREELYDNKNRPEPFSPAKLLIATDYGILILEEGFEEITDNYLGYSMQKMYYKNMDSVKLDICMLNGKFKIYSGGNELVLIEFETTKYFKDFEEFIKIIHDNKMAEYCK
ncbi:hypothetical protein C8C77_1445 [Halanaerobium saccharolyticum]|uniref:Uncharacterized protein n=1 Tax=Halanaerobium saccharolyticum TaxID=43595 RepID=A0A4R7YJH9_9FIRM|nr:hypothetical protein [Halanaerobium saccharolyticum]RAK04048.1 hypothetical protein C7958_1395 [Halanaerobium saccharolyticum]TDV97606.1 hypothetical protein C8C77_1445 [Halanaerobium saccharolyticum]TDX49232.1 hypothetical protein C7956_1435 [Halanaerobium saccharolyticum]